MADEKLENNEAPVESAGSNAQDLEIAAKRSETDITDVLQGPGEDIDRVVTQPDAETFGGDGLTDFERTFSGLDDIKPAKLGSEILDKSTLLSLLAQFQKPKEYSAEVYATSETQIRNAKTSQEIIDVYLQDIQGGINSQQRQAMIANVAQDPAALSTMVGMSGVLDAELKKNKGAFAAEKMVVQTYAAKSLSESIKDDLIVENWAGEMTKKHFRDTGMLENFWDGISLLFHPVVGAVELRDVAIALDPDFSGDPFEAWKQTIKGFRNANSAVKKAMVPKILSALVKGHNNNQFQVQAGMAMLFDPEFARQIEIERTLEIAEVGTFLATRPLTAGYKLLNGIKRMVSPVTQMNSMGNTRKAVQISKTVDADLKQAMDASPANWHKTDMGAGDSDGGLAVAHQEMYDEVVTNISERFREATDPGNFIRSQALSADEQKRAIEAVAAAKKIDGRIVRETEVMEHTNEGFKIKFAVQGKERGTGTVTSTGAPREIIKEYTFKLDNVGSYAAFDNASEITSSALIGGKVLSPDVIFNRVADGIVDAATAGANQASRLKTSLFKIAMKTEDSLKSLPILKFKGGKAVWVRGDARRQVNELVVAGDEAGEVWSMDFVMSAAVETITGKVPVSKEVYKAYLSKVALNEEAHGITNYLVRRSMILDGIKEGRWINAKTKNVEKGAVKPADNIKEWDVKDTDFILAPGLATKGGNFIRRSALNVEDAVDNKGYSMVTLQRPIRFNNQVVKKALLPNNSNNGLFDLPQQLLHKNVGYATRMRKPGYYYAKDADTGHTYGTFKTSEEAEAFGARIQEGFKGTGETISVRSVRDQDFTKLDALDALAEQHGGLIYGSRSKNKIFVDDAIEAGAERLSVGQSTQRMLENIASRLALDEFRMGAVRRWQNTVKKTLKENGIKEGDDLLRAVDDPTKWSTLNLSAINNSKVKRSLEVQRDWMIDTLSIPLNEEKVWSRFMYDWASTMSEGKFRDAVVHIGSKNPVSAFKAAVFNPYLGFFNVRQLYIQMQNASLAAAMYPIQAISAVPKAFIQKLFMHMDEGSYTELLKQSAKGIIPEKGLKDMAISLEQFKRSGLRDGIQTLDMMGSSLAGLTNGTLDAMKMVAKQGRMFFEQGEEMARLISWNIARSNWIKKNPGKAIDDEAITMIHNDTIRMNMNMQQTNAAQFQKGTLTGPMTQFFPVQAKMVENVVGGIMGGGRWSRKEAAQAAAGQIIIYGTLGVPIAEDAGAWLTQKLGNDPAQFQAESPALHKFVNQGAMGVFFNSIGLGQNNWSTDANLLVLDKSVPVELAKSFIKMMTGEQASIDLKAPLFGIAQRTHDAMLDTYNAARAVWLTPSFATLTEGVSETLSGWAAITSAWSNARKLRYAYHTGNLLTRKGKIIAGQGELDQISGFSLVAAAGGIKLDIESEYFEQRLWEMDEAKMVRDTKKAWRKVEQNFVFDHNFEKMQKMKSALLAEYEGNSSKRMDIEADMIRESLNPKSENRRQYLALITEMVQGGTVQVNSTALAADYANLKK